MLNSYLAAAFTNLTDKLFVEEKNGFRIQQATEQNRFDPKTIKTYQEKTVSELVTQRSMHLFIAFKLSSQSGFSVLGSPNMEC